MWRISNRTMSLQDVLIMAYMNVMEPKARTQPARVRDAQAGIGNTTVGDERHHQTT
jgi:hypothetical protein